MFTKNNNRKAIACVGIVAMLSERLNKKRSRRKWSKNWLLRRNDFSHMSLLRELRTNDPNDYRNYLRMDENTFNHLLNLVGPHLKKQDTVMRQAIPVEERLIATLRFLATGRSYEDLKFSTCIAAQTLGQVIPETCQVIYNVLKENYMKFPSTKQEWIEIAQGFKKRWQMINCGGALDGKHIRIERPALSGAQYYNYKNFYSTVLMALVNSNYEFVYVDVGKQGRLSDGGVIMATNFYDLLIKDELQFPSIDENDEKLNFVIVGDEAFALHTHILKPFSQKNLTNERRIYNYRISRCRNVVENAFGLMASRFRILHTKICIAPQKVNHIILAICTLHNYLRKTSASYITPSSVDVEDLSNGEIIEGNWRRDIHNSLVPLQLNPTKSVPLEAINNRQKYLEYFNGLGKVEWQQDMILQGRA